MTAYELARAIGRMSRLAQAVCSWLAYIVGVSFRRRVAVAIVLIAGVVGTRIAGGVVSQVFARAEPPLSYEERTALWKVAVKEAWVEGYSAPRLMPLGGESRYSYYGDFWVIFRGTTETGTHVDLDGKPITARCTHVYAKEAKRDDAVGLRAPYPYFLGFLTWPEATINCHMYDNKNGRIPHLNLPPPRTG